MQHADSRADQDTHLGAAAVAALELLLEDEGVASTISGTIPGLAVEALHNTGAAWAMASAAQAAAGRAMLVQHMPGLLEVFCCKQTPVSRRRAAGLALTRTAATHSGQQALQALDMGQFVEAAVCHPALAEAASSLLLQLRQDGNINLLLPYVQQLLVAAMHCGPPAVDADWSVTDVHAYQQQCMEAVPFIADDGIAGRDAVMQHVHSIVAAMQQTGWPNTAVGVLGCTSRLASVAAKCLAVLLQSENGVEAYLQQLQQAGEQQWQQNLSYHMKVFLQLASIPVEDEELHQWRSRQTALIAVRLLRDTPEGLQAMVRYADTFIQFMGSRSMGELMKLGCDTIIAMARQSDAAVELVAGHSLQRIGLIALQHLCGERYGACLACYTAISLLVAGAAGSQTPYSEQYRQCLRSVLLRTSQIPESLLSEHIESLGILAWAVTRSSIGRALFLSTSNMSIVLKLHGITRKYLSARDYLDLHGEELADFATYADSEAHLLQALCAVLEPYTSEGRPPAILADIVGHFVSCGQHPQPSTRNSLHGILCCIEEVLEPFLDFESGRRMLLPLRGLLQHAQDCGMADTCTVEMLPELDIEFLKLQESVEPAQLQLHRLAAALAQTWLRHAGCRHHNTGGRLSAEVSVLLQQFGRAAGRVEELRGLLQAAQAAATGFVIV